jgi:hypothetical protein
MGGNSSSSRVVEITIERGVYVDNFPFSLYFFPNPVEEKKSKNKSVK